MVCWDCHANVLVPVPVAPGAWVARLLKMTSRQLLEARTFTLLVIGSVLVTSSLSMPHLGPAIAGIARRIPNASIWAAAASLALVIVGYGELLRRGSRGDWAPRIRVAGLEKLWRAFLCLVGALALVTPLLIASGNQANPRITAFGIGLALASIVVVPLVLLGTYAGTGPVSSRARTVLAAIRRHPFAIFASLMMLPLSIVVVETTIFTIGRISDTFGFLFFDLNKPISSLSSVYGTPSVDGVDYRAMSGFQILELYLESVADGFSLTGTIPASLALSTTNGFNPIAIWLSPEGYVRLRMFFTLIIVVGMLSFLAVQARWLGLLTTIDSRRPAG